MSKFEKYFLMSEDDVIEYVKEKYNFFDKNQNLKCLEIGDGNLNYVFRVSDENNKSIIIKHSGIETRSKSGRIIDTARNKIEAEILIHQSQYTEYVPKILGYDEIMCCLVMEDLKEFSIMRKSLLEGKIFNHFADKITTYLVNICIPTTDIAMDHKEKKKLVKKYINPDLCSISEQLVFSEAILNTSKKNYTIDNMKQFIEKEIYEDDKLALECAKLKFEFMNHAQSLIHGDLHSGSIFINEKTIKVFDPEFTFYGPIGYDVGNIIAHLIFAMYHLNASKIENDDEFGKWIINTIKDIIDIFKAKFLLKYDELVTDDMAKIKGFKQYYLNNILANTSGTIGIELIRRIVGVAKVLDITNIKDENERARVEKKMIHTAKEFIFNRSDMLDGENFIDVINKLYKN